MIPDGWELKRLQDSGIAVIDGDRGKAYPSSDDYFRNGYCLFLSAKNVTKAGFVFDECQFITEAKHKQLRKGSVQPGDLVVTTRGTVGNVGYLLNLNGFEAVRINSGMVIIRNSEDIIETDFLHTLFRSPIIERQVERMNFGSAQPQLTVKIINSLKLPIPPEGERQRITGALETWNRAIETVEALIANARAQKHALMQQLLPQGTTPPKKRLPGFSGEWRELRLGTAFTERVERGEDGLALLSVTQANGVIPQVDAGRRNISSVDQSKYKTVCAGDIAYNTMRMWQGASALSGLTGKVSPAYTVVTTRNGHDALFYSYLFKQPKMIHVFERHSQGLVSDTWNLKFPHLAKIRIRVPGIEEQVAIAAAFKSVDDLIVAYEAQLTALRQEKAALMQQLLTGKRRVKLPESEVA